MHIITQLVLLAASFVFWTAALMCCSLADDEEDVFNKLMRRQCGMFGLFALMTTIVLVITIFIFNLS